jgi:hypothetical protein
MVSFVSQRHQQANKSQRLVHLDTTALQDLKLNVLPGTIVYPKLPHQLLPMALLVNLPTKVTILERVKHPKQLVLLDFTILSMVLPQLHPA